MLKSKDENLLSFICQPFCARTSGFGPKGEILLYASTRVTFHFILRHSRHLFVVPVMSPSFPSLLRHRCLFILLTVHYRLSSSLRLSSFVFRLFLCYGSIPPLLCSEHHFSDLWLRYHTLTSSHSCGWTISLLSS